VEVLNRYSSFADRGRPYFDTHIDDLVANDLERQGISHIQRICIQYADPEISFFAKLANELRIGSTPHILPSFNYAIEVNLMKSHSGHTSRDHSLEGGIFQWSEGYTSQFEHFTQSFLEAQEDCNNLVQQYQNAKLPFDLILAWSTFLQTRVSRVEDAIEEMMKSSSKWKSLVQRTA
jgi:hypothetical protein